MMARIASAAPPPPAHRRHTTAATKTTPRFSTLSVRRLSAVAALLVSLQGNPTSAETYNVLPGLDSASSDDDGGDTGSRGIISVSDAFDMAQGGDIIVLGDGTYTDRDDRIKTVRSGEEGNPITIVGGRGAVIKAPSPSVYIEHSWINLEGFTVDGEHGDDSSDQDSFVNKCVEVVGNGEDDPLQGFVMKGMEVGNCGGECVRLKNFVTNAEIVGNTIEECGLFDFRFDDGNKNGEGVYIGTSNKQWKDGPDGCNGNWVHGNFIKTCGNECIEVKEGSSGNLIEDNVCSNQRDPKAGCYGSRGDDNTIRFNTASSCYGAGVRLGGNEVDGIEYGMNNNVYGNTFTDVDAAALSIRVLPQGIICGNSCEGDMCILTMNDPLGDIIKTWDAACPEIDDDFDFPTDDNSDDGTPTAAPMAAPTFAPDDNSDDGTPTAAPMAAPTFAPDDNSDDGTPTAAPMAAPTFSPITILTLEPTAEQDGRV